LAVVVTEVQRVKTVERLVHHLFSVLSRQQVVVLGRQEQQAGMAVQEEAAGLTSQVALEIPRRHRRPKVITAVEERAPNQPVLVAGGQPQREPEP
jgi:hypothetical protein